MARKMQLAMIAGLVWGLGGAARGQTKTWDGEAGVPDWFADANWNPDGAPGIGDSVLVNSAGPVVCQSNTINVLSATISSGLIIDSGGLVLGGTSQITGLTIQGCCTAVVDTGGALTIDGVSTFLKGVRFQGTGETTIAGTAFFDDLLWVEGGHVVTLLGDASSDNSIDPRNGSQVVIEGTLEMLPGAAFRGSGGGVTRNLGTVKSVAPGDVWTFGSMTTESGTIRAEAGAFHLNGDNPVDHGTLEALPGAAIVLDTIASPEMHFATFTGGGDVTLRSGNVLYTGRNEAHVQFPGTLEVRGRCKNDGLFVSYGDMSLFGATLESPSGLGEFETRGFTTVMLGSTLQAPMWVKDGGTLALESSLSLQKDLTVERGGEISIATTEGYMSGTPGRVQIGGLLRIAHPDFGTLTLSAPVDLLDGGRIRAVSGNTQLRSDLVWAGGVLEVSGVSTKMTVGEPGRTLSVIGDVELSGGSESIFIGPSSHRLDIADRLRVTSGGGGIATVLVSSRITGAGVLENSGGMWIWNNASIEADVTNSGDLTLYGPLPLLAVITNTGRVTQSGDLAFDEGVVLNGGTWEVAVSAGNNSRQREITTGLITNTGSYEVVRQGSGDATHTVEVRFDNQATVRVLGMTAQFLDVAQIVGDLLAGGTWEAGEFGGRIEFPGTAIATIGPGTTVVGNTDSLPWLRGAALIDGGSCRIRGDSTLTLPLDVSAGSVDVETGQTDAPQIDVRDGGRLGVGDGAKIKSANRIKIHSVLDDIDGIVPLGLLPAPGVIETPLLDLGGRMRPGGPDRAGQFDVLGSVACAPGSQMVFDVGGADNTDAVTATGSVSLDGATLVVTLINEFTPQGGESFGLIDTLGGIFGGFSSLDLPALAPGLSWELSYGETAVVLSVIGGACQADWNEDGAVNTIDFIAYLNDWSEQRLQNCTGGGCTADLNGDGSVNTIDFITFLNLWVAGC